jgi:hypothetical protein
MLKLYRKNNMLATANTAEAAALHKFMRITKRVMYSEVRPRVVHGRGDG